MRTLSPALAARLQAPATTLAHAFVVTRADGATFGFTDHDRPLTVAGVVCEPGSGLDRSAATAHAGLAVGEEEIAGALVSGAITDADLAAGVWDGAEVAVHLVDWADPQYRLRLRTGRIGEVVRADGGFRAEIRGPAAALDGIAGRRYVAACDADLGDARCKVDLGPLTAPATVAAAEDAARLRLDGLGVYAAGWFTRGRLTVLTGPMTGATAMVDAHLVDPVGVTVLLRRALAAAPAAGTQVQVVAGCDKTFETCRKIFKNSDNFRGFPHIPGRDAAFAYARDGGLNDGGSIDG